MTFFTIEEFNNKYNLEMPQTDNWKIEAACEMIYSQIGLRYRNPNWDENTVPTPIKNASMEQLRFMYEYDIPLIDYKGEVKAGEMRNEFKSDYSTLALRILANNGYLYRGAPLNQNRTINLTWSN
jgi:hypothetical protein